MNGQLQFFESVVNPADVVYTSDVVVRNIISVLSPSGKCLDPCKGDGAFHKQMPVGSEYCELHEGKDFFDYRQKVDWIIGNPPYSIFKEFLEHSFNLSDNVSFLVPTNKVFQRQVIMEMINAYGGIKSMIIYGSGSLIGFPFGFSVGNFHFNKGYKGPTDLIMGIKNLSQLKIIHK